MITQMTIGKAVEYVLKNKRGYAFKDCTERHIASLIIKCDKLGGVVTLTNENDKMVGIACFIPYPTTKTIYVHDMVTTSKNALACFMTYFINHYPNWHLEAMRRGKFVEYDTLRFLTKVLTKQERQS